MTVLVGAYAALGSGLDETGQESVYDVLRSDPLVGGLELPFTHPWSASDVASAAVRLGSSGIAVLTAIPGLYRRAHQDAAFGPASTHEGGRGEAVAFLEAAYDAAGRLADAIGPERVAGVAIASSPRRRSLGDDAAASAFARSLARIAESAGELRTFVEHCDALVDGHAPAKGYLDLSTEIDVIRGLGEAGSRIGLTINWGRSAIEGRSGAHALAQVREARDSGLLASLIFSGCSGSVSAFGAAWADSHVPSRSEEPTSLLTAEAMSESLDGIPPDVVIGMKVTVPATWPAAERAALLVREAGRVDAARLGVEVER